MQTLLQIFIVNEPKAWAIEGRSGFSHSAECAVVDAAGEVQKVGVLKVKGARAELVAKLKPGFFMASFALEPNPASRVIEAVVTDLQPLKKTAAGFVAEGPAKQPAAV